MRPAAVITGLAGVATVCVLLTVGEAHIRGSAGDTDFAAMTQDELGALGAVSDSPPGEAVEAIQEQSVPAANPSETAQTAPTTSGPASEKPAAGAQAAKEAKTIELTRPVAEQAGVLSSGEKRVQLAGIVPTAIDRTCKGANGREWPCGMVAKTALRLFLRNRTVTCTTNDDQQKTVTAECRIGSQDVSTWLVENGWAEAEAGSPLAAAVEKAKQTKQGLYGDDPRGSGIR